MFFVTSEFWVVVQQIIVFVVFWGIIIMWLINRKRHNNVNSQYTLEGFIPIEDELKRFDFVAIDNHLRGALQAATKQILIKKVDEQEKEYINVYPVIPTTPMEQDIIWNLPVMEDFKKSDKYQINVIYKTELKSYILPSIEARLLCYIFDSCTNGEVTYTLTPLVNNKFK